MVAVEDLIAMMMLGGLLRARESIHLCRSSVRMDAVDQSNKRQMSIMV